MLGTTSATGAQIIASPSIQSTLSVTDPGGQSALSETGNSLRNSPLPKSCRLVYYLSPRSPVRPSPGRIRTEHQGAPSLPPFLLIAMMFIFLLILGWGRRAVRPITARPCRAPPRTYRPKMAFKVPASSHGSTVNGIDASVCSQTSAALYFPPSARRSTRNVSTGSGIARRFIRVRPKSSPGL